MVNIEISDGSNGNTVFGSMTVNPVNDPAFLITTAANIIQNGAAVEEENTADNILKDPDGTEDASVYDLIGGCCKLWVFQVFTALEVDLACSIMQSY